MNTDIRIAILTLSRGIIQSKADPLRREKLCPNLLSPKFADAQMSSNFLPKFFVLKYIEPKVLAHKFLNIKVMYITHVSCVKYHCFIDASLPYLHLVNLINDTIFIQINCDRHSRVTAYCHEPLRNKRKIVKCFVKVNTW